MRQKLLMVGLPLAVALIWLMVSWDPVEREPIPEDDESESSEPELPAAAATARTPAASKPALQAPAAPQPAEPEDEAEPPPEPEPTPTSRLERADPRVLDPNELTPPAASGPYKELQSLFESTARDSNSSQLESTIEDAFRSPEIPPDLLESVVCHGDVCRVRTRWTGQRAGGFMYAVVALGSMTQSEEDRTLLFARNYGISEASERNSNGEHSIDVYVHRKVSDPSLLQGVR